jgi:hypothetical protein
MQIYSNINKVERLYGSTNTINTINIKNTENTYGKFFRTKKVLW